MECSTVLMEEQQNCGSRYEINVSRYEIFHSVIRTMVIPYLLELYESM